MDAITPKQWRRKRIFVLGDVMLDRFVYGRVERISPEGPIPVLHHTSETAMLGGAANVARNIVSLGGRAILSGILGQDAAGDLVADELIPETGIEGSFVRCPDVPTTLKTRFVAGGQQILRHDVEVKLALDAETVALIVDRFAAVADSVDAVVLSDYAKGVLAPAVLRGVIDLAVARGIPVVVDPKTSDVGRYAGATVMTPNASEAAMISGYACDDDAKAAKAARLVRDAAGVSSVVLTRGAQGMTIYAPDSGVSEPVHLMTTAAEVFDVSGAGDTVVATLALALAAGARPIPGARIANMAAGIAVGKRGTAAVTTEELTLALHGTDRSDDKVVSNESAAAQVVAWKEAGLRVGLTNGCYDLLHPGHVSLLKQARAACDRLVVALNTDASVKRLKGESRPVQSEAARAIVMASIGSVDLVTLFEEDTPLELIEKLKPDVLIKGADYTVETVVGASFVQANGGEVVLVPIEVGFSTTSIIKRAEIGKSS